MEIFELFSGDKMVTYGNGDFISNSIHKHGCWEPNVTDTFINILKKYDSPIIFDVGCNIGYFSIISSKYSKQIFSFDANPNNINILNKSIELNEINNITPVHCCVSDNNEMFYRMDIDNTTNIGALKVYECGFEESNVNTIVLDDYIEKNNINDIHLIKIDVEGAELKCLEGLKKSFEKNIIKNIIIEITPLWGHDESVRIIDFLKNYFDLYNVGLIEDSSYDHYYENIIKNKISSINDINVDYEKNVQTNILGVKF